MPKHTAADIEEARLLAMLEHPHAAHAIADLSDDELGELAAAHAAEGDEAEDDERDEFRDPDATDIYADPEQESDEQ